jgi:hypothetical protein
MDGQSRPGKAQKKSGNPEWAPLEARKEVCIRDELVHFRPTASHLTLCSSVYNDASSSLLNRI